MQGITQEMVMEVKKKCLEELEAMPCYAHIPAKREVLLNYRGISFNIKVRSVSEQVDLSVSCLLKSLATATGQLIPLYCENDLVDTNLYKDMVGSV